MDQMLKSQTELDFTSVLVPTLTWDPMTNKGTDFKIENNLKFLGMILKFSGHSDCWWYLLCQGWFRTDAKRGRGQVHSGGHGEPRKVEEQSCGCGNKVWYEVMFTLNWLSLTILSQVFWWGDGRRHGKDEGPHGAVHEEGRMKMFTSWAPSLYDKYTGARMYDQHRARPKIDHTRGFFVNWSYKGAYW